MEGGDPGERGEGRDGGRREGWWEETPVRRGGRRREGWREEEEGGDFGERGRGREEILVRGEERERGREALEEEEESVREEIPVREGIVL